MHAAAQLVCVKGVHDNSTDIAPVKIRVACYDLETCGYDWGGRVRCEDVQYGWERSVAVISHTRVTKYYTGCNDCTGRSISFHYISPIHPLVSRYLTSISE